MKTKGPDFLCIGAQASGTSWLYQQLREHPDFDLPKKKEIHYFDKLHLGQRASGNFGRLIDIFRTADNWMDGFRLLGSRLARRYRTLRYGKLKKGRKIRPSRKKKKNQPVESDSAYLSIFDSNRISGDITPAYSTLSDSQVEKMAALLPHAKIVFLMRNPIDRVWSAYRKKLKKEAYDEYSWLETRYFLNQDGVSKRTNYIDTIDRYCTHFGKDRVLLGFYDAIIDQPDKLLTEIIEFLGGNPDIGQLQDKVDKVVNASPKLPIPADAELLLKQKYGPQIEQIAGRYGSYANLWLDELNGVTIRRDRPSASIRP